MWNLETGKILKTIEGFSTSITSILLSPDYKSIIVGGGNDLKISIFNQEDGKEKDFVL